jgi:hypothetical protein
MHYGLYKGDPYRGADRRSAIPGTGGPTGCHLIVSSRSKAGFVPDLGPELDPGDTIPLKLPGSPAMEKPEISKGKPAGESSG